MNNKPYRSTDDVEELFTLPNKEVRRESKKSVTVFDTFYLYEDIKEPTHYIPLLSALENAGPEDIIRLKINSYGGRLDSAITIIDHIKNCEGRVVAQLDGNVISAASAIALSCPLIDVRKHSSMMIHEAHYGSIGVAHNVADQVKFSTNFLNEFFNDVYSHFLTDEEMQNVLSGKELWLTDRQISDRLPAMFKGKYGHLENAVFLGEDDFVAEKPQQKQKVKRKARQKQ